MDSILTKQNNLDFTSLLMISRSDVNLEIFYLFDQEPVNQDPGNVVRNATHRPASLHVRSIDRASTLFQHGAR